jgi:hypothetical protein
VGLYLIGGAFTLRSGSLGIMSFDSVAVAIAVGGSALGFSKFRIISNPQLH